jgi:hypothetical protein
MAVFPPHAKPEGLSPEQTAAIQAELEAILKSPSFSGSKRCHEFLEFIIERAVAGDFEHLTERFLGVDLFGRPVDYETATDAVVRVRASDVRRRLSQHYLEQPSTSGVRIGLTSGSYIPEFHWTASEEPKRSEPGADSSSPMGVAQEPAVPAKAVHWARIRSLIRPVPVAVALLVLAGIFTAAWVRRPSAPHPALEQFWQPVFESKSPVTFCFGDTRTYYVTPELEKAFETDQQTISVKQGQVREVRGDAASYGNIRAFLSIMNLLSSRGVASQLRWPQEVQRAELEKTNVIYIGAFSNSWTMSLNQNLRFAFERVDTPGGFIWMIRDRYQPGRQWSLTHTYPQPIDRDYGLITRVLDPERKRVVISVGGLNMFGTQAAGEFLADGAALDSFARIAPKGWEKRNFQIVLEMGVSQNRAIDPKIVAINVW